MENLSLKDGNLGTQTIVVDITTPINKTADKKAYMRKYMKTYMPNYKTENPEKTKVIDNRKYWRAKFKLVDLVITDNDELDKLSTDDCHYICQMRKAKKYMETRTELFKYI